MKRLVVLVCALAMLAITAVSAVGGAFAAPPQNWICRDPGAVVQPTLDAVPGDDGWAAEVARCRDEGHHPVPGNRPH